MAYSELIKDFDRIREYMREFYVYGFRSRGEFTDKSARSYDDERRRVESWLGEYMRFRQTPEGRNVFLSIDSRVTRLNPLYRAWKAKSFTDGDITMHFILFDILYTPEICLTLNELTDEIDAYLRGFGEPRTFDASTIRKKLAEYVSEGIIISEKRGKAVYYRRADDAPAICPDIAAFFSETAPCGVIGSYLLDKTEAYEPPFAFKHHYITGALDSGIVCSLLSAISEKREVTLVNHSRRKSGRSENTVIPLRLMISAQSGRQYLMAYSMRSKGITSYRTDNIVSVTPGSISPCFDEMRERLDKMKAHMWGIGTNGTSGQRPEHVEFTVRYSDSETHIPRRLEREKRCGRVEYTGKNTCRFTADVYDTTEMIPWIRTFICRITDISFSNKRLEEQFKSDIREMYAIYGIEGGEDG